MAKWRQTIETIAAGQPRPYADTIHHVRVTFEHDFCGGKGWQPTESVDEEWVRKRLTAMECGFTDYKYDAKVDNSMDAYFRRRLDWLKSTAPGVWEFHTTEAFTD